MGEWSKPRVCKTLFRWFESSHVLKLSDNRTERTICPIGKTRETHSNFLTGLTFLYRNKTWEVRWFEPTPVCMTLNVSRTYTTRRAVIWLSACRKAENWEVAEWLIASHNGSTTDGRTWKHVSNVRIVSSQHMEGWVSGLNQQFAKLPTRKGPLVRIQYPPHW